jgi:excisionase family DNA binding protein
MIDQFKNDKGLDGLQTTKTNNTNSRTGNSQVKNTQSEKDCNGILEPLVTAEDVARYCNVSSRAVLLWADKGILPSLRIGSKTRRFRMSEVVQAIG